MSTKPVNNDMDMLSVSRIRNLPAATDASEPVIKSQLDASQTYLHVQSVPSSSWVVNHNLGRYPAATVIDSAGTVVVGDVQHITLNQCVLSFTGAFSGRVSLS